MRKKLVILSGLIAVNSLSYASGYDWQTPTENNWHVVIANGEMNHCMVGVHGGLFPRRPGEHNHSKRKRVRL